MIKDVGGYRGKRICSSCGRTHNTEKNYAWCKGYFEERQKFLDAMPDGHCHLDPYYDKMLWGVIREWIMERDEFLCKDCGAEPIHGAVHHIIERMNGGETSPDNLVYLCDICHKKRHYKLRKHDSKTLDEFEAPLNNITRTVTVME